MERLSAAIAWAVKMVVLLGNFDEEARPLLTVASVVEWYKKMLAMSYYFLVFFVMLLVHMTARVDEEGHQVCWDVVAREQKMMVLCVVCPCSELLLKVEGQMEGS